MFSLLRHPDAWSGSAKTFVTESIMLVECGELCTARQMLTGAG